MEEDASAYDVTYKKTCSRRGKRQLCDIQAALLLLFPFFRELRCVRKCCREGPMKRSILLVAYGVATQEGRRVLHAFDGRVRTTFPGYAVRWAFSSDILRRRLAEERQKSDSVVKALRRMCFERFEQIIVQPLQTIPGREHEEVLEDVAIVRAERQLDIRVGTPLLNSRQDVMRLARCLLAYAPQERAPSEDLVFMGHGSRHPACSLYGELNAAVQSMDSRVFVGTIDGPVTLDTLLPRLLSRRVWLMPLLSTVGRHTLRDMAGSGSSSWRSRLEAAGHNCLPVLKGTIEHADIAEIWLDHLLEAVDAEADSVSHLREGCDKARSSAVLGEA